jgi:tripartite-type tricarboxylate transporter receptor subunit TctC
MKLGRRAALTGAAIGTVSSLTAVAQDAGLRIVVPFGAGSGTDNTMRVFAEAMRQATGRTVIVDDKPGGGTTIGSLEVSRARPDGSTVLYTTGGHTTNAVLMRKLPYDPVEGFTAITLLSRSQGFGLFVAGNSRFPTLAAYLAEARANPGRITYGSSGIGNTTHVVGELFCRSAGVQLTHVPYKTTPIADAMSGTIDSFFVSPSLSCPTCSRASCARWASRARGACRNCPIRRPSASTASTPTFPPGRASGGRPKCRPRPSSRSIETS